MSLMDLTILAAAVGFLLAWLRTQYRLEANLTAQRLLETEQEKSAATLQSKVEALERSIANLEALQARCRDLEAFAEEIPDKLGTHSKELIVEYFVAMRSAINVSLKELEGAAEQIDPALEIAQEEADRTRLIDRQKRFSEIATSLAETGQALPELIRSKRDDVATIEVVLEVLSSGRFDEHFYRVDTAHVYRALKRLENEATSDLRERLLLKMKKRETSLAQQLREKLIEVDDRLREQEEPNPRVLKAQRTFDDE